MKQQRKWEQVLMECEVGKITALSPQAKGKVERSYRWIQDHIVRRCAREKISTIQETQELLDTEIKEYNYKRIHSMLEEIPARRFERAKRKEID